MFKPYFKFYSNISLPQCSTSPFIFPLCVLQANQVIKYQDTFFIVVFKCFWIRQNFSILSGFPYLLFVSSAWPASQFSLLLSSKLAGDMASSPDLTLPGVPAPETLEGWFLLILGGTKVRGSCVGRGSPFIPISQRCMATMNSSTLSFPS